MRTVFCLLLTFSIYSAASAQAPPQDEPRIGSLLLLDAIDGVQLPRHGVPKVIGGIPARTLGTIHGRLPCLLQTMPSSVVAA